MTKSWSPPLPSIGRAGPRIAVENDSTLLKKLEDYFCERRSIPDIFECRISPSFQKVALRYRCAPRYLSEMSPSEQQSVLLRNLYFKVSAACRSKLRAELDSGGLHHVRSWFHTANAAVLPLLITCRDEPSYAQLDSLIAWAIENCANNYARFQSLWKETKKRMRKSYALHDDLDHVDSEPTMAPYLNACRWASIQYEMDSPAAFGRFILTWTQTRATGMANSKMMFASLEKFKTTVQELASPVHMNPEVLRSVCLSAVGLDGRTAKVSAGPTACLESTRAKGGKTAFLSHLASHYVIDRTYDLETLESVRTERRPVRSPQDLLDWAICQLLEKPTYTSCLRVHVVAEPSKARVITVAPFAYQVVMGVFAHLFQPALRARGIRSGLKADRHLWRFMQETLNPHNVSWQKIIDDNVFALSTDLSEATDWGHRSVARQIWQGLIEASKCDGFPLALAVLAKTKYCGKRFAFVPDQLGNYELIILQRGWMMGDMMTKVILTLSHQYCCVKSRVAIYSLVGDDEISLDSDPRVLEKQISTLGEIFKVSELDTYVSRNFAFYCEEGMVLPQRVHQTTAVQIKRGQELNYLDYPRIRLLLPQIIETDAYSMTNIGRFALLGKETKWVHSVNTPAAPAFDIAGLLQHLLVPQDKDTISPYTPLEIGGDGAFPHSHQFMKRVVDDKSFNPRETKARLSALVNNKFVHKYVRSARLDKVVHKHHLYLPKVEGLEALLPPESIVRPRDQNHRVLLQSLHTDELVDPQALFFELAKGAYYSALLRGETPPEPVFDIDRSYSDGHTEDANVDYPLLLSMWMNPGFVTQSNWGYWVLRKEIPRIQPMSLGWFWDQTKKPGSQEVFNAWLRSEVDFKEASMSELLECVRKAEPLPVRLASRLHLFFESDSYIMHTADSLAQKTNYALISRDQRLGLRLERYLRTKRPHVNVHVVDPLIYLIGRLDEVGEDMEPVEDPGAMLYVDYTEFTDGSHIKLGDDIWGAEIRTFKNRHGLSVSLVVQ